MGNAQKQIFDRDGEVSIPDSTRAVALSDYEIWSVSHEETGIASREQLARINTGELCKHIVGSKIASEAVIVSTCNRFEIYLFALKFPEQLALTIAELSGLSGIEWKKYHGIDAVQHSFNVSSGMSSMVLGETQILGQMKNAYDHFVQAKTVGKFLHSLFQFTFKVAKRVRDKTSISREGVSVGSIAVRLAREVLGELASKKILLIGSGEQAEVTLMHLKGAGAREVTVANRTLSRAAELAERFEGSAVSLTEIPKIISQVDLVVGSVSVDHPLIDAQMVRSARHRTRVFLDLGVPRNFSSSIVEVGDSYLYTIDDLSRLAQVGCDRREEASKDAETVVAYGIIKFREWFKKVLLQSTIIGLREKITKLVGEAVSDSVVAHGIAEKISHEVLTIVKSASNDELSASDETYSDALLPVFIERFYRA